MNSLTREHPLKHPLRLNTSSYMNRIYIVLICFFWFVQAGLSQTKEEIIKQYQTGVFYDENFEFDGKTLTLPDLRTSYNKASTCYDEEEPIEEGIRFYDCVVKEDGEEYDLIISNREENSFFATYISRLGRKNYIKEVKTRAITTKIENGRVSAQCVCDFNTLPDAFRQSVFDIKCHLITSETAALLNALYTKENHNKPEIWNQFIAYLNSREYKREFTEMTKVVYNDIFTSINKKINKRWYDKYKRYDRSKVFSTLDIIREMESEHNTIVKTTTELLAFKPLAKEIGINFLSKIGALGASDYGKKKTYVDVNLLELNFD